MSTCWLWLCAGPSAGLIRLTLQRKADENPKEASAISVPIHGTPMRQGPFMLLGPFTNDRNEAKKMWRDLPSVPGLEAGRTGVQTQTP